MRSEGSFYVQRVKRKSRKLVQKLHLLKKDENYLSLKKSLKKLSKKIEEDLAAQRKKMKTSKLSRRLQKKEAESNLDATILTF